MMAFAGVSNEERKRDCEAIVKLFGDLIKESGKLDAGDRDLEAEILKLEDDLRAIDARIAKELEDNITVDFARRRRPRIPGLRKGRGELEDQLDELQDALGGLEVGVKLGNDLQRRHQDDLEGDGATLSFKSPGERLALVDRLENAREELRQVEAQLDTNRAHFEELRDRFSARRCSDFNIPPALMMHLPPPRRP